MLPFAQRHAITDVCLLVRDVETSVAFYRDKLGFVLKHRAEGFADFTGAGMTLALWESAHIGRHAGVAVTQDRPASVLIAVKLDSSDDVEATYQELSTKGVAFTGPPADYSWNARGAYFAGPDGEIWELYAWLEGGAPGKMPEMISAI
jgi:catechol 2,3-dioxygenase-like lactoylglutathione lyase family enzyme